MSSESAKVKVNAQEKTFEVEGSEEFIREMTEKIKELFENTPSAKSQKGEKKVAKKGDTTTKSKRGGQRSSVVSPAIDKLTDEGFFNDFKKVSEVIDELKRIGIPGVTPQNVGAALARRVPDTLDRIKSSGTWNYKKK